MKTVKVLMLTGSLIRRFIAESPFLCLDLNMFGLSLPPQRSLFDHLCYFVHDNNHDHQNDDADEDVGRLENSRRHANEKANAFGGRNEFTDDRADDREGDARPNSGKEVRRNRREDHFESQLPSLDAHEPRQVDVLLVHLPHARVGNKKVQKKGK
jgi:hypothetical protein